MPGDRRVGRVGQADLGQADATAAGGHVGRGAAGEEAVEKDCVQGLAWKLGLDRAPDDFRAATQDRHRRRGFLGAGEEGFLGGLGRHSSGRPAAWRRAPSMPLGSVPGDGMGQGEVHVIAAEQDVLADRQAGQCQISP